MLLLRSGGFLEALELGAYERLIRARPHASAPPAPITLVRIVEADIQRFGHPLCDDLLALEKLGAAGPRAIGVDLYRDVAVPNCPAGAVAAAGGPPRQDLASVATASGRVVMVMKFPDEQGVGTAGPYFLHDTSHVGFSDLPVDPGGTTRRGLLFPWDADVAHVSFSLQLALRHLQDEGIGLAPDPSDPDIVRIGTTAPDVT